MGNSFFKLPSVAAQVSPAMASQIVEPPLENISSGQQTKKDAMSTDSKRLPTTNVCAKQHALPLRFFCGFPNLTNNPFLAIELDRLVSHISMPFE